LASAKTKLATRTLIVCVHMIDPPSEKILVGAAVRRFFETSGQGHTCHGAKLWLQI